MIVRRQFIKTLGTAALTLCGSMYLVACSAPKSPVVGKWSLRSYRFGTATFRFNEDGTYEFIGDSDEETHSGNWTMDDNGYVYLDTMDTQFFEVRDNNELWMHCSDEKSEHSDDTMLTKLVD